MFSILPCSCDIACTPSSNSLPEIEHCNPGVPHGSWPVGCRISFPWNSRADLSWLRTGGRTAPDSSEASCDRTETLPGRRPLCWHQQDMSARRPLPIALLPRRCRLQASCRRHWYSAGRTRRRQSTAPDHAPLHSRGAIQVGAAL